MSLRFHAAPWPSTLKMISLIGTIALSAICYAAYRAIPTPEGFTHNFGLGVAAIPALVLVSTVLFIVRGYTVENNCLSISRLLTQTRIPLSGLVRVWIEPNICHDSVRVCGNGGLFSFTGWFYSRRLGRYRFFATDTKNTVVLQFHDRVVVISPATPRAFVEHLHHTIPDLTIGPENP